MKQPTNPRQSVDFRVTLLAMSLLLFGTALTAWFTPRATGVTILSVILASLGTTLVASAMVTLVWEIFVRRTFLQEILAEVGLSANIKESGLQRVEHEFSHVDWKSFYANAKLVQLIIFHASHTLTMNVGRFVHDAAKNGTKFDVILPDVTNDALIAKLAKMDGNRDSTVIRGKVQDAIDGFRGLPSAGSRVSIRCSCHLHPFALYLSDKTAILALNPEPTFTEPVILVCDRGGALYRYAQTHFEAIKSDSIAMGNLHIQ